MKVTKLEHSCLIVEAADRSVIVDPGSMTTAVVGVSNAVAVVITHEHADHWTAEQLTRILDLSPDARIFGPAGVVAAASAFEVTAVADGDEHEVGPFTLRFFGGKHAVIHPSIPVVDNIGVLINDELYYAGDSFTIPQGMTVGTLAVPASAPWMKISEAMDYVLAVKPRRSFPVHEMLLSTAGKSLSNTRIKDVTEAGGGEFFALQPNESIDL